MKNYLRTYLHGITWDDVADRPTFPEFWPILNKALKGVEFIAAHNASFDRSVLHACCGLDGITPPQVEYLCTMKLARRLWGLYPTKLSDVCRHFSISLKHHDAASDALSCARNREEISSSASIGGS